MHRITESIIGRSIPATPDDVPASPPPAISKRSSFAPSPALSACGRRRTTIFRTKTRQRRVGNASWDECYARHRRFFKLRPVSSEPQREPSVRGRAHRPSRSPTGADATTDYGWMRSLADGRRSWPGSQPPTAERSQFQSMGLMGASLRATTNMMGLPVRS